MIEFNERKVIRNRNVVREMDRNSAHELRGYILVGFIFAGLMCAYNWQQHRMVEYGYRMEELKKETAQLEESRRKLQLEQAILESPGRISQLALDKLGLAAPTTHQIIYETALEASRNQQDATLVLDLSRTRTVPNPNRETLRTQ